jgi:hypothetical protein
MRVYDSESNLACLFLWHVCKQTHVESRSLLFENVTFRIGRQRGFDSFLSGVSASELNAIQTVRISSYIGRVLAYGDLMRNCYKYLDPPVPRGFRLLNLLDSFGGLKRIVLEKSDFKRWHMNSAAEHDFTTIVKRCLGDRSELVEIICGADDWLCEIGAPIYRPRMPIWACYGFGD